MPERCGYCGRFVRIVDFDGWSIEPSCSQQRQHILDDPEHWSIPTPSGWVAAHTLSHSELVEALRAPDRQNGGQS